MEDKKQLFISDARMLQLMDFVIEKKLRDIDTQKGFFQAIGANERNLSNFRAGSQGFTKEHLHAAGNLFGVSLDWFFGFTDRMFRNKEAKLEPLDQLKEAVKRVEEELNAKKRLSKKQL